MMDFRSHALPKQKCMAWTWGYRKESPSTPSCCEEGMLFPAARTRLKKTHEKINDQDIYKPVQPVFKVQAIFSPPLCYLHTLTRSSLLFINAPDRHAHTQKDRPRLSIHRRQQRNPPSRTQPFFFLCLSAPSIPPRHTTPHHTKKKKHSHDVEQALQLLHERPLLVADLGAVELLERVDALPRDHRVQRVLLLEVPAVHGLVGPFDLDGHRRLAALADGDLLVVALDGLAVFFF